MVMARKPRSFSELVHMSAKRNLTPEDSGDKPMHEDHRDITGGAARAAVFGISDGLVSNTTLILGVAGAHPASGLVRLAGLAGLVGGAFSMAIGEYVSMAAQRELFEREIAIEAAEIHGRPDFEKKELARIYESRGVPRDLAEQFAAHMMDDPEVALATHAKEELGIDPSSIGSPIQAAVSSFVAFAVGALVPLSPWFFTTGTTGIYISVVVAIIASILIGAALSWATGRSLVKSVARQLILSAIAAGITFTLGRVIGFSAG
ncbi:MAG: VIT1/CCC1 transporter family protein [Nitrospiraceae bacterium]|nr:VIT1/CCC1 transporter family protein [Nitrospiraceae bacterium]